MDTKRKKYAIKQFSAAGEADLWNELYQDTKSVFHYHMLLRRDHTYSYIQDNIPKTANILDLGCGAGVLMERLLEGGYTPVGVDMSQDMLDLASKRCDRFKSYQYELVQADCIDLPFDENRFDMVVCLGMFGYFNETVQALKEIRRVLRPQGQLILSVRNRTHQIIFDPASFLRTIYKRKVSRKKKKHLINKSEKIREDEHLNGNKDQLKQANVSKGAGFIIDMFETPSYLISGVQKNGYSLVRFEGIGYGPINFLEHSVIPEKMSIWVSRITEKLFRLIGIHKLSRWIADVSIYTFKNNNTEA